MFQSTRWLLGRKKGDGMGALVTNAGATKRVMKYNTNT
jgi:hypothetical protein